MLKFIHVAALCGIESSVQAVEHASLCNASTLTSGIKANCAPNVCMKIFNPLTPFAHINAISITVTTVVAYGFIFKCVISSSTAVYALVS